MCSQMYPYLLQQLKKKGFYHHHSEREQGHQPEHLHRGVPARRCKWTMEHVPQELGDYRRCATDVD